MKIDWLELNHPTAAQLAHRRQLNVPPIVYYRRAVYALALERLESIAIELEDFIDSGRSKMTGKVWDSRSEIGIGEVRRRGKGIMPSLQRTYPELKHWDSGPARLLKVIRDAKTPEYFRLLQGAIHQVESRSGEQLELFITRQATRQQLDELAPVMYPAHQGKRSCRYCKKPHPASLHRFHLRGAYTQTHPSPAAKRSNKEEREEQRARLKAGSEAPF